MNNKLTNKDIERMEQEIEHRKLVVRKEALEAVKEARAQGDLSENFEYYAAKRDKNQNESRIRYLERMIKTAEIVSDEADDNEVGIDNEVVLYFEDDDDTDTFTLVTTTQVDPLKNIVSIESPIGKAIWKKHLGDRVYIAVNDNDGYYAVIKEIHK